MFPFVNKFEQFIIVHATMAGDFFMLRNHKFFSEEKGPTLWEKLFGRTPTKDTVATVPVTIGTSTTASTTPSTTTMLFTTPTTTSVASTTMPPTESTTMTTTPSTSVASTTMPPTESTTMATTPSYLTQEHAHGKLMEHLLLVHRDNQLQSWVTLVVLLCIAVAVVIFFVIKLVKVTRNKTVVYHNNNVHSISMQNLHNDAALIESALANEYEAFKYEQAGHQPKTLSLASPPPLPPRNYVGGNAFNNSAYS